MVHVSCVQELLLALAAVAVLGSSAPGQMTCDPTDVTLHVGGCEQDIVISYQPDFTIFVTAVPPGVSISSLSEITDSEGKATFTIECTAPGGPANVVFASGPDTCSTSVTCVPQVVSYCTAGGGGVGEVNLEWAGLPSASNAAPFLIQENGGPGFSSGIIFFGTNGRQANPWGNGSSFQCVVPPVMRGALILGGGTFSYDLNDRWATKPAQNPGVGKVVQAQLWYRDPFNTSNQTTSLSDALEFCVGP